MLCLSLVQTPESIFLYPYFEGTFQVEWTKLVHKEMYFHEAQWGWSQLRRPQGILERFKQIFFMTEP